MSTAAAKFPAFINTGEVKTILNVKQNDTALLHLSFHSGIFPTQQLSYKLYLCKA